MGASGVLADRYELYEPIGEGGSATVFRARDRVLDREVAVKVFGPSSGGGERARHDRELRLLSRMHHPNLVELFDAGESESRAFLVMRLVEGPSLAGKLADGPLPIATASALTAELAAALHYVHAQGVTHRDVKPANVLLGDRPMLSDFGISLLVDSTRITSNGYMIGTAAYMSPEQVRGAVVGPPTDIYALGLVLLEALTGATAYGGPPAEAAIARLSRPPTIPAALPSGLGELIARMTADDPASRPVAAVVAHELHDLATELNGGPLAVPAFLGTHQHTRRTPPPSAGVTGAGGAGPAGPGVGVPSRFPPPERSSLAAGPEAPGARSPAAAPTTARPARRGALVAMSLVALALLIAAGWLLSQLLAPTPTPSPAPTVAPPEASAPASTTPPTPEQPTGRAGTGSGTTGSEPTRRAPGGAAASRAPAAAPQAPGQQQKPEKRGESEGGDG